MRKKLTILLVLSVISACKTIPLKDREHLSSRVMKWGSPKTVASIHGADLERSSIDTNSGSGSCVSCAQ
jgi:hypothetical protein